MLSLRGHCEKSLVSPHDSVRIAREIYYTCSVVYSRSRLLSNFIRIGMDSFVLTDYEGERAGEFWITENYRKIRFLFLEGKMCSEFKEYLDVVHDFLFSIVIVKHWFKEIQRGPRRLTWQNSTISWESRHLKRACELFSAWNIGQTKGVGSMDVAFAYFG